MTTCFNDKSLLCRSPKIQVRVRVLGVKVSPELGTPELTGERSIGSCLVLVRHPLFLVGLESWTRVGFPSTPDDRNHPGPGSEIGLLHPWREPPDGKGVGERVGPTEPVKTLRRLPSTKNETPKENSKIVTP